METTKISLNIPNEVLERVKKLAEKADMEYTRLLVNMIDETSKTLDSCGKVGILQFSTLLRNLGEKMNDWAKAIKSKKVELP